MLGLRGPLDIGPFLVGHKSSPGGGFGLLVPSFEQKDEFRAQRCAGFAHRSDSKSVPPHDAGRVLAKARVEDGLVDVEDLVAAQLVDHVGLAGLSDMRAI